MAELKDTLDAAIRQGIVPRMRHQDPAWLERRPDHARTVASLRAARHLRCDVPLLTIARQYTTMCPDRLPSLSGLCLVCSICMTTLYRWRDYPATICERLFGDVCLTVNTMQEHACLNTHPNQSKDEGPNVALAMRVLAAKHGYQERVEQQTTHIEHVIMHYDEYQETKQVDCRDVTSPQLPAGKD